MHIIGLLWLASLRWKLPPTFIASAGYRSLLDWLQLEVTHPTVNLYADFVATIVIPNFLLFAWLTFLKNRVAPTGPGVDLAKSRLALICSAGAYVHDTQAPFDAPNPLGDYTIRLFPSTTPFEALAYAHDHYDHTAVEADPQVLLPLRHMADLVSEGVVGELAPSVISFSGYLPDVVRVVNELIPAIVGAAKAEQIDAALLVPA